MIKVVYKQFIVYLHSYTFWANCNKMFFIPLVTRTWVKRTAKSKYICRRILWLRGLMKQFTVCLTLSKSKSVLNKPLFSTAWIGFSNWVLTSDDCLLVCFIILLYFSGKDPIVVLRDFSKSHVFLFAFFSRKKKAISRKTKAISSPSVRKRLFLYVRNWGPESLKTRSRPPKNTADATPKKDVF